MNGRCAAQMDRSGRKIDAARRQAQNRERDIPPRIKACVRRLRETENKPEQQIRAILPCRPVCRCDRMN